MAPGTGELPTHLLYMLVFGGLVLVAVTTLLVEFGTRAGKRRLGMAFWSVVTALVGAVLFAINVANVIHESAGIG